MYNYARICELILFKSQGGNVTVDVKLNQDIIWLSLNQISQLFGMDKSVISRHISNIFKNEDLE